MKPLKQCMTVFFILVFLFFGQFQMGKSMPFANEIYNQYSCKPFIMTNYDEVVPVNNYIQISYKLLNGTNDYNVLCDGNNINIINNTNNNDGVNTILIEPYDERAFIDIVYTNSLTLNEKYMIRIYIYCDEEYYYISEVSFEQCVANSKRNKTSYLDDSLQYGINACDDVDYQNNRSNYITVTGIVQWTDSATNLHLGKDVKVEVWDMNGTVENLLLASGYTNDEGRYSFTFLNDKSSSENGYDIRVKYFSTNSYINIVNPSTESTYIIVHPTVTTDVNNDAVVTKSIIVDNNTADERSFQVLQAMTMAAKYAKKMNSNTALSSINVIFPNSSGTFYSSTNGKLHILAADYCDWDVMQHEYGHYTRDF